jgi:two-component system, OmpR family, sensor histidine kinase MtrB
VSARSRFAPSGLRRRIAVAFALSVAAATGALAVGSYLIVRSARLDDSAARAVSQSRFNLSFAATVSTSDALLAAFRTRGDFCSLILPAEGVPIRSGPFCPGAREVPPGVRTLIARGRLGRERVEIAGRHQIAVGGPVPGRREAVVFFYDEQQVWDDLAALRNVLAVGWLVLSLLAAVGGGLLARRVLAPVARASSAARSMAEGRLDTRLPVAGSDEFAEWAAAFNEMADALEATIAKLSAAEQRERAFTANVAHELRTPLTALLAEAQLLYDQSGDLPDEQRRITELLVHDVDRMRHLTDELLEISRLDAGTEATQTELVDVGEVIRAVVTAGGWAGDVAVDAGRLLVTTDRRRLERILTNLVANAVRHGGTGVRVTMTAAGDDVEIVVSDDGPGIPAAYLPHVFDRFSKGDRSRSADGSGLGLAIALEHAHLLGGTLSVESSEGAGAAFTLRLPVAGPLRDGEGSVAFGGHDGSVESEV